MMTTEDVIKELLQESGLGKDAIIVSVNSDLLRRAARDLESLTAENERLRPILEAALLYDAWAANGDYPHDEDGCAAHDAIRHAVRSYQQQEVSEK